MTFSKHNIVTQIKDSDDFLIVNLIGKSADIISSQELNMLEQGIDPTGVFAQRGYLMEKDDEKRAFTHAYLDFTDKLESDELQLFFVPNYGCNFACAYCYQEQYNVAQQKWSKAVVDALLEYVQSTFAGRKKYITLFGGEPLLSGKNERDLVTYFLQKSTDTNIAVAIVTNGYTLVDYLDILRTANIKEVQVTLDGTEAIHNARRYLKSKQPTFTRIVAGIDACLMANIPINLRMVVDKDNMDNLPEFAQFAIEKGWTTSPLFKTQIGRNYELHHCNSTPEKLFSRILLYEKIYELLQVHPHIIEFYKPAFSIARHIAEYAELPEPLFDSCPACKTEWAFDYTGTIYSCTATVGKKGEELGTFYPTVTKNDTAIDTWQNRDITTIESCKNCSVALACGGGCASVAKNKYGNTNAPDCRPIKELLSLGAAFYLHSHHKN